MLKVFRIFFTFAGIMLLLGTIVDDGWASAGERFSYALLSICMLAIWQPSAFVRILRWVIKRITSAYRKLLKLFNAERILHSDMPEEGSGYSDDCSDPDPHDTDSTEEAAQEFAPKINDEVKEDEPEQALATNNGCDEGHSEPLLEAQPVLAEQPAEEAPEDESVEPSTRLTTAESIPDPCNADIDTEGISSNDQEPDKFDRIRDPETMAHYIVLDIETTGFSRDNDRIIEIAAIHYVFGEEVNRFHTYVNPQMQIPRHITRLTGIRQTDVDTAPLLEDIADDFREFIRDYPLVGHNIVEFDWPFLISCMDLEAPHFMIDTLDMARSAFPMLPSHKLSNLNFWFDLNDGDPHRADADAAATNALMWACLYPDKYASLYRKAVRDGIPEAKHAHKAEAHYRPDRICITEIKPSQAQLDMAKPLLGKKIVFTGELSVARKDAMQMAVDAGAVLRSSVSCKTNILVVGKQDPSVVGADGMSTKQEKAQEINTSGKGNIEIIDEAEFMSMISPVSKSGTN